MEASVETFFDSGSEPLLWPSGQAAVTQIAATSSWPPTLGAVGYAPGVRAWQPEGKASHCSFSPVPVLQETDGENYIACALEGNLFIAADASPVGRIFIWSGVQGSDSSSSGKTKASVSSQAASWTRLPTLEAGAPLACMSARGDHIAVGTTTGAAIVWRHAPGGTEYLPLFDKPLQLDTHPLFCVRLSTGPDGTPLMVVHASGKNAIGVWRLTDGKLQRMEMRTDPDDMQAVVAANMVQCHLEGPVLAGVSYLEGQNPVVQLMNVLTREGQLVDAPDRLSGRGRPLCSAFDGALLAVGFADGALATFGLRGWLRWHPGGGAVGAVALSAQPPADEGQLAVVSGGADGLVCGWSLSGDLLLTVNLGFQVTSLVCGDIFWAAGGERGHIQIIAVPPSQGESGVSHQATAAMQQPATCTQYQLSYDFRAHKRLASRKDEAAVSSAKGVVELQSSAHLASFIPQRQPATVDHFRQLLKQREQQQQGADPKEESSSGGIGEKGSGSKFDMKAAMKGAQVSEQEVEAAREAAKKEKLRQMGEGAGVARTSAVLLDSSVERLGRKCDNGSCLIRSGMTGVKFSRCGRCKARYYCSEHCQRTHWRDSHSKECANLAALVQQQQREREQGAQALLQPKQQDDAGVNHQVATGGDQQRHQSSISDGAAAEAGTNHSRSAAGQPHANGTAASMSTQALSTAKAAAQHEKEQGAAAVAARLQSGLDLSELD